MTNTTVSEMETAAGPDESTKFEWEEESDNSYLPGDTFTMPGLKVKKGLKLVEAKCEETLEDFFYEYDHVIQIKVTAHADTNVYGSDEKSKSKLLLDVNKWLRRGKGEDSNDIKVVKVDIISSETSLHVVNATIVLDEVDNKLLGEVVDSSFHRNFWNKRMNNIITEGVCYAKGKVSDDLKRSLEAHIDEVAEKTPVDYHPKSNNVVRDLVHPALYPYVKGISKIKEVLESPQEPETPHFYGDVDDFWGRPYEDSKFQWLPTPFKVTKEGKCKIQAYINNLDKSLFPGLYQDLEKLFEIFLPNFEEVWSYAKAMVFWTGEDDDYDYDEEPPFVKEPVSFKGKELQIIVKIVDYELQPKQSYEGVWHAEGMSHENIVMTGIYFLDRSDHLEGGDLRFKRAFTQAERNYAKSHVPQSRPVVVNDFAQEGFVPLGRFPTEEGYLLVFPNCHIHKISRIVNNSAGKEVARRRIVVFFFVNPETRIVSTREVEPQQNVIPLETAKKYRLKLMEQRKYAKDNLNVRGIELCEH